jgi:hypothetical protein
VPLEIGAPLQVIVGLDGARIRLHVSFEGIERVASRKPHHGTLARDKCRGLSAEAARAESPRESLPVRCGNAGDADGRPLEVAR